VVAIKHAPINSGKAGELPGRARYWSQQSSQRLKHRGISGQCIGVIASQLRAKQLHLVVAGLREKVFRSFHS
jgi:hypothetical protein